MTQRNTTYARARERRADRRIADWGPAYLAALEANRGQKTKAAAGAGVTFSAIRQRRLHDAQFVANEQAVMETVSDILESEILRRAIDGVQKPIYGKGGVVLGVETTYSDMLLLAAAKRVDPTWREKQQIEHTSGAFATREERKKALAAAEVALGRTLPTSSGQS